MVKLTIKNKTGAKTTVTMRGPAYYQFKPKANKTEKVYVKKGTYQYTYEACGEKITKTISVQTGKEKLTLAKCKKPKKSSQKIAKVTIVNNTGRYLTLYLDGPESYYFSLKPGKSTIEVIKGKYHYRAYGYGGASRSGTQNLRNGFRWQWFCI